MRFLSINAVTPGACGVMQLILETASHYHMLVASLIYIWEFMFWYVPPPFAESIMFFLIAGYFIVYLTRWTNRLRVLAREGAMFRDMINLVKDVAVTVHDIDDGGRVIYANDAACRHFGLSRRTLLTWPPTNWNSYFDASSVADQFESGNSLVFETEHRNASGELVPVEVMHICQIRDGVRITIAYTRDIRARQAAQARSLEYERDEVERTALRRLSRLIGNTPGYFCTVIQRPDGSIAMPFASSGIQEIYGLRPEEVEQDVSRLVAAIHPDDEVQNLAAMAESARTMLPFQFEFRVHHPEKGWRWVEARSIPQREPDGSVLWHGFTHDITERKRTEQALVASKQEFRTLAENLPASIVRYDQNARPVYLNPAARRKLAFGTSALPSATIDELRETPSGAFYRHKVLQVLETASPVEFEFIVNPLPGTSVARYYHVHIVPEYGHDGQLIGALKLAHDITDRKQLEQDLQKREALFRELVEHLPDTVARYDRNCRRVYANATLVASLGGDLAQILGKTPIETAGGISGLEEYQAAIREVVAQGKEQNFELRLQQGEHEICRYVRISPEFDVSGQVVQVLSIGRDITEIDQYRKKIHHQAFFDALTGLPNRTLLSDRIHRAITDAAYHGHQFGLMMLDLDNFRDINDTMGYGVGDELLYVVAKRLLTCVHSYGTVARLGGDEFSVLLPNMRRGDDLAKIADNILREVAEPFAIDGQEIFVTCSIGIALYPGDSTEIDVLYKYADSAMFHAKKMGRNNFQFYEPEFTSRSQERVETEAALRKALKKGEFVLYYQPQIELQSGRLVSAEALLRWQRPGHGLVAPDRFIPIAEASGLIVGIGELVLSTACRDAVCWNRERVTPVRVAVNLSTRQFTRNDLVGTVRRTLDETGCKPAWLELEITESLLLEDSSEVAAMLAALHEMGLSISIDDFGTGYSALSYLSHFPVGQIKIDRSFVNEIPAQRDKCELTKAMLSIASALHLETVAEGVETIEQAEYLTAHGCRLAQGYLFGRPMPLAEFEARIGVGGYVPIR